MMLQQIYLRHFKCFEELKLPLAPLTLLTGLNASGKSTTIQALALLHQTLTGHPNSPGLVLNGKNVSLGSARELLNENSGRESFTIGLTHDDLSISWDLRAEADNLIAPVQFTRYRGVQGWNEPTQAELELDDGIHNLGLANNERYYPLLDTLRTLTYVSADRIGPRDTYPASSPTQQDGVGARGEYAPWFIKQYDYLEIPDQMRREGRGIQLDQQVEAWLAFFFPGSRLDVQSVQGTNLLTMGLTTSRAGNKYYRPANVGYGLSHVLPVITACLGAVGFAARHGRISPLVLVENPELHLHPAGQSAMGVFLAQAAAAGAQVIIETHSDHVLNGIRLAVHGGGQQPKIAADKVQLHFFERQTNDDGIIHNVVSPRIDRDGRIDRWPEGFFDEWDKNLEALLEPRSEA